ncbi:hypothetical protein QYE76_006605 [Lolium multiflorum]|uniref:CCHC-type domain-containing protein n=1 Tax=Lolium multiflorum TaxID=4521 RepID=A0AAD8RVY7_LOLMU|nr:hypothetical protein QYE76_006605 [Lolium multiflorum]
MICGLRRERACDWGFSGEAGARAVAAAKGSTTPMALRAAKGQGYADKPPFKPLPPKEGNEEKEEKKKKKGTKKKKKKENKKKESNKLMRYSALRKSLNSLSVLTHKFVAMHYCQVASWRNFATTPKHKRHEISVENLIASLDVEEKARAKDTTEKGEGQSSANMVQKKPYSKNKGNNKPSFNKPMKTTTFKKKKMINKADLNCFTCGETCHFSKDCLERADRKKKARQVNTVTTSNVDGYSNLCTIISISMLVD